MRQISMSFLKNYKNEFGGSLLVGKRKERRPLSVKNPIHLVLRSDLSGVFNPGNRSLEKLIRKTAQKFQVKIYDIALNWSHIHCVVRVKARKNYNAFIRALTGTIARKIQISGKFSDKIFSLRPFTRILQWGKDFRNAINYQILNQLEARGLVQRKERRSKSKSNKTGKSSG